MKKQDIVPILVISFFGVIFAIIVSNSLFPSSKKKPQEVEKVAELSDKFDAPDKLYFNSESINPTQIITIGDNQKNQ